MCERVAPGQGQIPEPSDVIKMGEQGAESARLEEPNRRNKRKVQKRTVGFPVPPPDTTTPLTEMEKREVAGAGGSGDTRWDHPGSCEEGSDSWERPGLEL